MSDGAALLEKYLSRKGLGLRAFARAAKIPPSQVCRWLRRGKSPGLRDAFAVEDATARAVPARSWVNGKKQ